ncbi:amidohydrolase [Nitriliruptoraceae bacterium ZYF776]|nr:amidohydrolase [Profundirhabdus halotolerans]
MTDAVTAEVPPALEEEAPGVRAVWEALGLPGIVDVHTHFLPPSVLRKVWAYFDRAGPLTGRRWPITYRTDDADRVARLRAYGVRTFTALAYPHKPEMAAWLNDWTLDFAARTPGCLPSATLYPEPSAEADVTSALERGARIFKAHVQVGDYDPNDPQLRAAWGALADAQVPTVIHAGSGPAPGRFTGPEAVARLLATHPRLPLIVAHLGMPEHAAFLDLADRYPSVALDTTMTFTDFTEGLAPFPVALRPRLVELQDRILLGSDFPNIPHRYVHQLEALVRLELGDGWLRDVLHDNAARRFGLDATA